jgi:diaminopimelate decarboxylase
MRSEANSGEGPSGGVARDRQGRLCCGGVPLSELIRSAGVGTPVYVYDLDAIAATGRRLSAALPRGSVCAYAIKANGAEPIVRALVHEGCGVDVVSGGELAAALSCGVSPDRVVYSGVAKRDDELDRAITAGIRGIHVESVEEIERIAARAEALGARDVGLAIRHNPDVEVETHANIATGHDEAKFGIAMEDVDAALEAIRRSPRLSLRGLSAHVGSQIMRDEEYLAGVKAVCELATAVRAKGFALRYLDTGGGFGVSYRDEHATPDPTRFVASALAELRAHGHGDLDLVIEPGRSLVAAHGVLVTRVIQPKRSATGRKWLLVDAGMNDLIRPALYQAHHRIEPLESKPGEGRVAFRVAGPVCESSDDFGEYLLPDPPRPLLAIRDAGAYGRSMASAYNTRPLAAEIFVARRTIAAVRQAESLDETVARELGVTLSPATGRA